MSDDNLRDTVAPKSDQLNADDLIGTTKTIKVTDVTRGTTEQPVNVHYENDQGRPYKPCKSMRRVLIGCWGENGKDWVGKSMTLYNDPEVMFGGVKVGGIRISHVSDIDTPIDMSLTVTRSKRKPYRVDPLKAAVPAWYPADKFEKAQDAMRKQIQENGKTADQVIAKCEQTGKLTDEQKATIRGFEQAANEQPEDDEDF